MEIKKVAWKWPAAVKRPEVYRDHEYVVSKTKEEALEAIDFLLKQPKGLTYTTTVYVEGEYRTYYLYNMPCLGGWVKYKDTHGDKYAMNPYFPRDIYVNFPDGEVVFLGLSRYGAHVLHDDPYYQFLLSDESPWITGFNKRENVFIKDKYIVLTDMNTDPTVWYHLLRYGSLKDTTFYEGTFKDPRAHLLHSFWRTADPRRLAGQRPLKISGGTWAEGYGYTRPYNDAIFRLKLPHTLSQFHTLNSSQPTYTPSMDTSYMKDTMQKKFNVDMSNLSSNDEPAMLDAWAFFKEEAKKLEA